MLEMIFVGMLGAIGVMLVAQTIDESLRLFDVEAPRRSSGPESDDELRWRTVQQRTDDAGDEDRKAA